jgi:hypothetical protein
MIKRQRGLQLQPVKSVSRSAAREAIPSLVNICRRWESIVRGLR